MFNILIKCWSLSLLPECFYCFYYSFLGRIFRIFGSICVIICLCGCNISCIYVNVFIEIFASDYLFLLIFLSIVKIIYGFYILYNRYSINLTFNGIIFYIIVLFKVIIIFILNIMGISILEGFMEMVLYVCDVRRDLCILYKKILEMFL